MTWRPPQPTFSLKSMLDGLGNLSDAIADVAAVSELVAFLSEHRFELVKGLRDGAIEETRTLIRGFLFDVPAAAGIVNYLMTENPDTAINAIGMYDFALAESLRGCKENFVRLQTSWANVRDNPPRVRG